MDIIRGGRRPATASRSLRPSSGARRSWARDSAGVPDAGGRLRTRPQTAPASRSQLIRPGSADSKQLRELYKGVNVGRGARPVTSGGKVDAHMIVAALDSVEHTEAQLKAMRRIMQLCDPKPSAKLAAANCRALAAAGGIPVLVSPSTRRAAQPSGPSQASANDLSCPPSAPHQLSPGPRINILRSGRATSIFALLIYQKSHENKMHLCLQNFKKTIPKIIRSRYQFGGC